MLLILVAAGLMSHTFHTLGELGIVPELVQGVWNLEWLISIESLLGRVLHAFVGYESSPSLMQVIVYNVYVLVLGRMCMGGAKEIHS
jgi:high-affinity iron transporter